MGCQNHTESSELVVSVCVSQKSMWRGRSPVSALAEQPQRISRKTRDKKCQEAKCMNTESDHETNLIYGQTPFSRREFYFTEDAGRVFGNIMGIILSK